MPAVQGQMTALGRLGRAAKPVPVRIVGGAVLLIAVAALWAGMQSGRASRAVGYLDGERVFVEPAILAFGRHAPGTIAEGSVRITNKSDRDLTLMGAEKFCTCVTLEEFPILVPKGETHELKIKLQFGMTPGSEERLIRIFTDYGYFRTFTVKLTADVR